MAKATSIDHRVRSSVIVGLLVMTITSTVGQRSLAESDQDGVGKRVIIKLGARLRVDQRVLDDQKFENAGPQQWGSLRRIYRVEQVNGPWLRLQDDENRAAGWVTADWIVPYDRAIEYFTSEIRANSLNAVAFARRGQIRRDMKRLDQALADCNEAIRIDRNFAFAYEQRGNVWSDRKEYDKAIADYGRAIYLEPNDATAYNNRGIAWSNKKEYDKAIADYAAAIRLNPEDAGAYYYNRSLVWQARNEHEKAIADLGEAIRLNPENADAYVLRGVVWHVRREFDKSNADFDEASRLDPQFARAHIPPRALANRKTIASARSKVDGADRVGPIHALARYLHGVPWPAKNQDVKAIADDLGAKMLDRKDPDTVGSRSMGPRP